jgi:hypothetical protein
MKATIVYGFQLPYGTLIEDAIEAKFGLTMGVEKTRGCGFTYGFEMDFMDVVEFYNDAEYADNVRKDMMEFLQWTKIYTNIKKQVATIEDCRMASIITGDFYYRNTPNLMIYME